MSLSNRPEQIRGGSVAYEPFKMEAFDIQEPSFVLQSDGQVFRPFYDDYNNESSSFENMVPDTTEDAQKIIDNAEKIVAEAKSKAASIEQTAYEKGFAQGEKDGREIGAKKIDKILGDIQHVLEKMITYKDEFAKVHEKAILDLVCRIAQKVVCGRAEVDHAIVRETIFRTFALAADRSEMTVKVSPADVEYVKDLRPSFFERIKDLKSITIESDPTISPGGCVLETAFGHVDGRLEGQLEKITESVKEAYSQQSGEA